MIIKRKSVECFADNSCERGLEPTMNQKLVRTVLFISSVLLLAQFTLALPHDSSGLIQQDYPRFTTHKVGPVHYDGLISQDVPPSSVSTKLAASLESQRHVSRGHSSSLSPRDASVVMGPSRQFDSKTGVWSHREAMSEEKRNRFILSWQEHRKKANASVTSFEGRSWSEDSTRQCSGNCYPVLQYQR